MWTFTCIPNKLHVCAGKTLRSVPLFTPMLHLLLECQYLWHRTTCHLANSTIHSPSQGKEKHGARQSFLFRSNENKNFYLLEFMHFSLFILWEGDREKKREIPKNVLHCHHRAQCRARSHKLRDHDLRSKLLTHWAPQTPRIPAFFKAMIPCWRKHAESPCY